MHDCAEQRHALPPSVAHDRPGPQGAPVPHAQLPLGQALALGPHGAQLWPAGAHCVAEVGCTHSPAAQHPAQLSASQMHTPPSQRFPGPHGAFVPQPQVPLARQVLAFWASQTTQAPPSRPHASLVGGVTQVSP